MRAVLPKDVAIIPVGGINAGNMQEFWEKGASGFGIGGALYKPGTTPAEIEVRAAELMKVMQGWPNS